MSIPERIVFMSKRRLLVSVLVVLLPLVFLAGNLLANGQQSGWADISAN